MLKIILTMISIACFMPPVLSIDRNVTYPVGIQSFIKVTKPQSLNGKYGCTAAHFMSEDFTVSANVYSLKMQLSDPCTSIDETYTSIDAIVVLKNSNCTAYNMAENVMVAGAGAVIIASNLPGQPVYALPTDEVLQKLNMISCMIDNAFYIALKEISMKQEDQTQVNVMASLNEVKSYDISKDYPVVFPEHNPTVLTITSPFEFKWRYPAVMASYNPKQTKAVTSKIVTPAFREECTPDFNIVNGRLNTLGSMCEVCWELESPFENELINDGNIVMFNTYGWNSRSNDSPQPWCFYNDYPTITHLAQETGAEAVVFVGDSYSLYVIGPYLSPYDITIASYYISRPEGQAMLDAMSTDKYPDIIAKLPPIKNGSGPEYYLQELDLRVIPETTITVDEIANGKSMTYTVGQATYNPDTYDSQVLDIMRGVVDPSCAIDPNSDEDNLHGVDCDKCGDILHSKTESIFKWDDSLVNDDGAPDALLVYSKELYCVDSWATAVNEAAKFLDVKAVFFGNSGDYTTTHVSADDEHGEDKAVVPGFNIRKRDAEAIAESIQSKDFVYVVNIPAIKNGISEIEVGSMDSRLHEIVGAEIKMSGPESLEGIHIAGQSAFNPTTHLGFKSQLLVKAHLHPSCNPNSSHGCHGCELLSSPFYHPVSMEGNVAFIMESDTRCLKPFANYAKFAENAGAVGVLFSNEYNHVIGMGPSENFGLTIPSFNINRDTGVELDKKLRAFGNIYLSFPPLAEGLAPEDYYTIQKQEENDEQFVEPTSSIATTRIYVAPTEMIPQPEEVVATKSPSSSTEEKKVTTESPPPVKDGSDIASIPSPGKGVAEKEGQDVGTTDEPMEEDDGNVFSTAIYATGILAFIGFFILVVHTVVKNFFFVHNYDDLDETSSGGEKSSSFGASIQPSEHELSSIAVDESKYTVSV